MKHVVWGLLIVMLAVVGCQSSSAPVVDCRVTIAPELYGRVLVKDVRLSKEGGLQYTMQANVVNTVNGISRLEYRVDWLDAAGEVIPSVVSTWQPYSLAALEIGALQATAPTPEAVDFRFYVKQSR